MNVTATVLEHLDVGERALFVKYARKLAPKRNGTPVPSDWRQRIPLTFPRYASAPFGRRHEEFWEWENGIRIESAPRPFTAFWPRGGAKSTSVEMGVTDLGCRGNRRYCLYVRETQDKADASVQNIAALLESLEVERHYPEHAKRKVGKHGNAKGWRRNRLWTAGGFAVDALGLDVASRGVKLEDQRPDLIVFDDVDDLHDGPAQTKRKLEILTKSILPAGSNNCAVIFIQNLIIRDGIASQLADGRADFLSRRIVSGPFPALEGFKYEWRTDHEGRRRAFIVQGTPTWEGQPLDACQRFIDTWGLTAFLKEAQHMVQGRGEGVCLRYEPGRHLVDLTDDEVRDLVERRGAKLFGGVDFGEWRFGFTLWMVTAKNTALRAGSLAGRVIRIDELFSQKESLAARAKKMHEIVVNAGVDAEYQAIHLWGDAANPQDIRELNLAFRNGWDEEDEQGHPTGRRVISKLRIAPVAMENKARETAVMRMNDHLDANTLLFRRGVGSDHEWMLGANAAGEGAPMRQSRFLWEVGNWAVPIPQEGKAQRQNPDDDTADGADLIASARYALMSAWRPGALVQQFGVVPDDTAKSFDYKRRQLKEPPHVKDTLFNPASRRTPRVSGVRPRIGR